MESDTHTILIADDESELLTIYEAWLDDEFDVITVRNGRDAIANLSAGVDLLVCDRGMPSVTGDEVVAWLRDADLEIPVIVVSSRKPDAELRSDDVARYLRKPVDRNTVTTAVRDILG